MKKLFLILIIILIFPLINVAQFSYAIDGDVLENYVVYNEKGEVICERSSVDVGDSFITSDYSEYEITRVENHKAYAVLVKKHKKPKITPKKDIIRRKTAQRGELKKKICLYMTHNDESYRPSDGYESVYGAGGIHDVAKKFKLTLEGKGIEVVLDETLHIPHNSSAYSRSSQTASRLLDEERPDAMFDVHRDGVSRSYYYVNDGKNEFSKIRIVVGKSNPNFEENYQFAQSVFALGNEMYPSLFSDIYLGKGHYNQSLQPTDLLFEMGTYLIEKELVYNSLPMLADVVDTMLYSSVIDEEGNIEVETQSTDDSHASIIPHLEKENENVTSQKKGGWIWAMITSFLMLGILITGGYFLYKKSKPDIK